MAVTFSARLLTPSWGRRPEWPFSRLRWPYPARPGPILRDGGAFYALTGRTYCAAC
jgi:hypothetical protein